jgi:hypothetical protein
LAIWDVLFGTARYDVADAPTGIDDASFPVERAADPASVARTWLAQFVHPFRQLLARRRQPDERSA